jgi:phosphatidylserine decarboxylase
LKKPIEYIDRRSGKLICETVMGDGALRFAYETFLGKSLSGLLFNTSGLSRLMGWFYDSPLSRKRINDLAAIPGCCPDEAEQPPEAYKSFNDFFTRRLKQGARPFDPAPEQLSSPADGRILVYEDLAPSDAIPVKGARRTLNDLCCETLPAASLAVAVIRLAPVDYHRFHFPCACIQKEFPVKVKGKYHSVNPVALKVRPDLYVENTRQITTLESDLFGSFRYLEVGAFGVGSIIQYTGPGTHDKLAEKGCFKFGGSTVILIFDNAKLKWSSDLLQNSASGHETLIRMGETVAAAR